ncbi:MAG: EamA family transporter, partial [Acidovorax sp.]
MSSLLHRYQRFVPFLAVLGAVTALGIGTSWAKHYLFPLVGATFWALYIVFGKRVGHLHAGHSVSLGLVAAAVVVVPVGVVHAG